MDDTKKVCKINYKGKKGRVYANMGHFLVVANMKSVPTPKKETRMKPISRYNTYELQRI